MVSEFLQRLLWTRARVSLPVFLSLEQELEEIKACSRSELEERIRELDAVARGWRVPEGESVLDEPFPHLERAAAVRRELVKLALEAGWYRKEPAAADR